MSLVCGRKLHNHCGWWESKARQGKLIGGRTSEMAKEKIVQVPHSTDFPRDVEQPDRDKDKSRKLGYELETMMHGQ